MRRERKEREEREKRMEEFWVFDFGSRKLVSVLYPGGNEQGCRHFPLDMVVIGDARETL